MTLRIHFTTQDLSRVVLAQQPDPMWEILLSLHQLQDRRSAELIWGSWRRRALGSVPRTDLRRLVELAPFHGYSPDFLTPGESSTDFAVGMDRLLSTPRGTIRSQLDYLATRKPATSWLRSVARAERADLHVLSHSLRQYHRAAIAPHWSAIRQHVAADRNRRGAELATHGVGHLLRNLHPRVHWHEPVLEVLDFVDSDVYLDGRGLRLQPSFFCWQAPTKLRDTDLPPVLVYPIRLAPGALASQRVHGAERTLGALLGRSRATILSALEGAASTTQLAERVGVSLATVSQHTALLRDAGLITTRRTGMSVRHELTALGRALLEAPGGQTF